MADTYDYHIDNLPGAPTRAKLNDNFTNIKNNKADKADTDGAIQDLQTNKLEKTATAADSAKLGGLVPDGYARKVHSHTADDLPNGTTTAPGILQLLDSVTSTSTTYAATAKSVKTAYDKGQSAYTLAQSAKTKADAAYPKAGGDLNGTINYTPDNGNVITLDNKTVLYRHTAAGAISFGADEAVVIGSGESRNLTTQNVDMGSEELHLSSDNKVTVRSNLQGGWLSRKEFVFETDGGFLPANVEKTVKNLGLRPAIVGELCRFSFETVPAGFFALDGSTIPNGKIDYPELVASGSAFITISGNDLILADAVDFGRGKGSSGRSVGSFEGDAIRNITGYIDANDWGIVRSSGTQAGALHRSHPCPNFSGQGHAGSPSNQLAFDASRVVPTASENRPKSLTELVCIYHGVF